jgi:hypothetical protein
MYRGFTRSEAVGLVCNFSGKLLTGAFLDTLSSFFYSRLAWSYMMTNFPLYGINKYLCVVLFFLADGSCKILFSHSTGAESKTVEEEKKALYQIRRPLGLVFVISFGGWENCCHSIFR